MTDKTKSTRGDLQPLWLWLIAGAAVLVVSAAVVGLAEWIDVDIPDAIAIIAASIAAIALLIVVGAILYQAYRLSRPPASTRTTRPRAPRQAVGERGHAVWLLALACAMLIAVPLVGVLVVNGIGGTVPQAITVGAAVVVGIGLLLVLIAIVGEAYRLSRGESSDADAFGLPGGSVRALIAFAVMVVFVALVVYVLGTVLKPQSPEATAAAQQVVGALVTLVAAVSAFYFGANSVKSGAAAVASLTTAQAARPPQAITKGTTPDGLKLVGNVTPVGAPTRYFFEYTRTTSDTAPAAYENATPVGDLPAGNTPVEVEATVDPRLMADMWMRIVAFNVNGTAQGRPHRVEEPPPAADDTGTPGNGDDGTQGAETGDQTVSETGDQTVSETGDQTVSETGDEDAAQDADPSTPPEPDGEEDAADADAPPAPRRRSRRAKQDDEEANPDI